MKHTRLSRQSPADAPESAAETRHGTALISKAVRVLEVIEDASAALGLGDLARRTGMPKSTTHRILAALVRERFVAFDEASQTYTLGLKLFELARRVWTDLDVRAAAENAIRELNDHTGETVHLALRDAKEVVYIDKLDSNQRIRMYSAVGKRGPLHCTGVGKAILAFLPEDHLDAILTDLPLPRFTERTLCDAKSLKAHLTTIRVRGYALDEGEHEDGIHCVAAPVFNVRGLPIAAIGVTGPGFRISLERLLEMAPLVCDAARCVSALLGTRGSR
jgi:DNA-binding IclR family transcriptional regulator